MSYEYSEKTLVQDSAGNLLHDELSWEVTNTEKLGESGAFGRKTIGKLWPSDICSSL